MGKMKKDGRIRAVCKDGQAHNEALPDELLQKKVRR